jgi:hypothetical protein
LLSTVDRPGKLRLSIVGVSADQTAHSDTSRIDGVSSHL